MFKKIDVNNIEVIDLKPIEREYNGGSMKIKSRKFLPSTTRSVHAATIEWWKDHFVYSWFGGTQEGQSDVAIYIYNLNNKGETLAIGRGDQYPRWNPILFAFNDRLYLFEKIGMFCDRWQTVVHDITDWDITLNEMNALKNGQFLPAGLNGPVKLRPVVYKDRILCGSAHETFSDWTSYIEEYVVEDGIWKNIGRSNPLFVKEKVFFIDSYGNKRRSLGIIQPTLWEDEGKMKAFFRSSWGLGNIYYSEMIEMGKWTDPVKTNLLNNNSGVSAVNYNDKLYLAFNNSNKFRYPLVVSEIKNCESLENIKSEATLLINDKDEKNMLMEFSYPYMIEHDGCLHLCYTYNRQKIEHVEISL